MKKLKGGVESIVALMIIVGLVIALIIAVILPMTQQTSEIGKEGATRMTDLKNEMKGK